MYRAPTDDGGLAIRPCSSRGASHVLRIERELTPAPLRALH
jgi:hypothetical protein